jgi:hypothetical protein
MGPTTAVEDLLINGYILVTKNNYHIPIVYQACYVVESDGRTGFYIVMPSTRYKVKQTGLKAVYIVCTVERIT